MTVRVAISQTFGLVVEGISACDRSLKATLSTPCTGWFEVNASTEGSVMHKHINIDKTHSQAICREIGERLRVYLRVESDLPMNLRKQVNLLHELAPQFRSIGPGVEHGSENKPSSGVRGQDRSRFRPWQRKN
jgi:hypothetical protein